MCRLARRLGYFGLPPDATLVELRRAYLRRAKEVHPDTGPRRCPRAFHELRSNFDEACELLRAREAGTSRPSGDVHEGAAAWDARWHAQTMGRRPGTYAAPEAVPVVGLPPRFVYTAVASLLATASAGLLLSQLLQRFREASPRSRGARPVKAAPASTTEAVQDPRQGWPALQSGPWSVLEARAEAALRGNSAPSKGPELMGSSSFYVKRTRGHLREGVGQRSRLGEEQGGQIRGFSYEDTHQPLNRDGVQMLPVHAAAQDGSIWWLERCGAASSCRSMLTEGDSVGDTPLHHCARRGSVVACQALLRMGAEPDARSGAGLLPEEAAAAAGHAALAADLRQAREGARGEELRHPDGLGVLTKPPEDVTFVGLRSAECLRRAVDMAIGYNVTPALPVTRGVLESPDWVTRLVGVVRDGLQNTEFDLQDMSLEAGSAEALWTASRDGEPVPCGLLLYEPPGRVSADAPGHWVAVRRRWPAAAGSASAAATGAAQQVTDRGVAGGAVQPEPMASGPEFWRLDPVRGPFKLTPAEFEELVRRYRVWRVLSGVPRRRTSAKERVPQIQV